MSRRVLSREHRTCAYITILGVTNHNNILIIFPLVNISANSLQNVLSHSTHSKSYAAMACVNSDDALNIVYKAVVIGVLCRDSDMSISYLTTETVVKYINSADNSMQKSLTYGKKERKAAVADSEIGRSDERKARMSRLIEAILWSLSWSLRVDIIVIVGR